MISFKDSNIYLDGKKIVKGNLTIKGNKFDSFQKNKSAIKLDDKYFIVPGFIEEHIHGANGCDTMDNKANSLDIIAKSLVKDGVTSFCPTTMTMAKKDIISSLKKIANKKYKNGEAKIIGVHLEGPFISEEYKGAQDAKFILKPNIKDMTSFIKASNNKIRIATIAVEKASKDFFQFLKKNKITISAGHSNAKINEVEQAIKCGCNCTTHTYNAMSKLHHRDIGLVGSALLHKEIYSELILDLHHVSKEAAQLLLLNKDKDKLILITDSMEARFMKDGEYKLGTFPVYVKNDMAVLKDGTLAGSILTVQQELKNAKKIFPLKFEEIIDLITKNPANNLKAKNIGYIKKGYYADFTIIDKDFNVYQTYVNGKLVFNKEGFKL